MFTGIIEATGKVIGLEKEGTNLNISVSSPIGNELKIDQSVAHNGVCLTVTAINDNVHIVTAVAETLAKTNLGDWQEGDLVNLERCLRFEGRLDGHFVQGHVDTIATCIKKVAQDGSWLFRFKFPKEHAALIIEKGSVCINGVSLTCFDIGIDEFTVTIIPYTYEHTNFKSLEEGDKVNIEFDVLGKYMNRIVAVNKS